MSHLPSPPLSTSSAPPNPWWTPRQEDGLAHARQAMKLSIGSAAALDAAWLEGQPPESPSPPSPGDLSPPKGSPPAEPMLALQVLARVVDSSKGRDKFLKCMQYTLKTYIYLLSLLPLPLPLRAPLPRLAISVASLSLVRKCLLLLNSLRPLASLLAPTPMSPRTMLLHLLDLAGAIADDTVCLAKIGLLRRNLGQRAEAWANRFWLLTTIIALYKLRFHTIPRIQAYQAGQYGQPRISSERQVTRRKPEQQLKEAKWTNRKLVADLLFVSYDIFNPNLPASIRSVLGEPLKCTTGLVSGLISLTKLYNQHWDASLSKG
ncbi:hypothetical protein C361_01477 [Cryptococcus neoformans Tu259-1]|uniref:Uncharacterized protein n=1 Tax=Cryptococcus neoformans Tu259-1 TaxID=1230072 RepID=A0A854QJI7_CRYNE|nr:hypothetical protein C353_01497 [Cryptococcus neoformans var. grubii AD1-83a]OXG26120.1 hypothetical protein C361_01477 [Cryptococcus neoformans var. grubii Tu259-1]OXG65494.1 hypothetical protein C354_01508 [Cryptococcus neoformans var. grubii MW-RSA1955]OXG67462.1 hypothetical protein C351_01335 [Cryptococcus neoformans var. grubii c8]OXG70494.1 hypothetical protein C352_01514 [Cryptococcus neoformans var. grubii CHC193]OXH16087.1 hypothetical protein C369_01484 [Cryptococcus neoformans v